MTPRTCVFFAAVVLFSGVAGVSRAQNTSTTSSSLGDAARKTRAEKKDSAKAAKVFTNEDMGSLRGTINVVGAEPAPAPAGGADAADKTKTPAKTPKDEPKKAGPSEEASWRAKFATARKVLAQDQKEMDILQRELNLKQQQYSQDPNWAMHEQNTRGDINKTRDEIDAKRQDVEKDKQALSDLEDALRKAGGDPGWASEPAGAGPSASNGSGSGSAASSADASNSGNSNSQAPAQP